MMDSVQKGLRNHLALAGFQVAEAEIFDLVPVVRLCLGEELLEFPASLVADAKKLIHGLRR